MQISTFSKICREVLFMKYENAVDGMWGVIGRQFD